jgi:hypothetical protein
MEARSLLRIVRPLLVALLLAGPVAGQEKPTPVDSTQVDSAPPGPHHPLMLPAIVGAGLVLAVAPPVLLLPPGAGHRSGGALLKRC